MMKIIVCVKQITHIYVQNGYDAGSKDIVTEGLVHMINPYDEVAVEEGLRLKEKYGCSVTVLTRGPEKTESILRWCLAMGADKAVQVIAEQSNFPDPWRTATALADVIQKNKVDLVLFGKKAMDDQMGQVGTFVAELLHFPVVTAVTEIESLNSDTVTVRRALERGNQEEVICAVPAVLTVDKTLNRPRYPTFPDRKAAQNMSVEKIIAPIETTAFGDLKIDTVRLAPPKLRPKKILSPDSSLSASARINFVMTGGIGSKKRETMSGDPKQAVSGIIEFLKEKHVIGKT
jgi:electron transfer flavoprotein beta subunit